MHILDVQKPEDFQKKHIKGSFGTGAYPVKTEEDRKKLDALIEKIKKDELDIVIICPRGAGAAKNTYDYIKSMGISEKRLFILEGGIQGFPHTGLCEIN